MSGGCVRPAGPGDVEGVCRLLHERMNPRIVPERWRRLMSYGWLPQKPDLGRVAVVEGRIAGYVGAVHADREIGGRRERVVNICAWYLETSCRGRGLGFELMRQATEDERRHYTILTSSAHTLKLLDALGYRVLDRDRHWWTADGAAPPGLEIERDPARVLARIAPPQRRMLEDHAGLPVAPMLISDRGASCLAVFSIKTRRGEVLHFDALHISDPAFFAPRAQAVADALLPRDRPAALAVDARLLSGQEAGGRIEALPVPRFYKSRTLHPAQLDNLYSELQLLDLKLD